MEIQKPAERSTVRSESHAIRTGALQSLLGVGILSVGKEKKACRLCTPHIEKREPKF